MTDVSSPWVERMAPSHSTIPLIPDFVDNLPAPRLSKRHLLTIVMTITRQNQLLLSDSNKLLNGFFFCFVPFKVWRRRLVLRHKLTMHTAFAREDNSAPAAITSLLVSKWVLWFLWTDQSIDRENDRPNSRPNERSTDWTKTGTSDFSIDRRTNEWTNGKRRTINDERWIKNDQQWTTNKRTNEGKAEKRTDHLINKRRNEQASERTTERTNEPTDYERSDWRIFKTSFNTARYFFGSCCCQWSCKGFSHPSLWIKYRSFSTFYRDHRKLFVGDFRGRIYSWSVTDAAGMDRSCW